MDKSRRLRSKKKANMEFKQNEESKASDSKKVYICPYKGCGKQFSESGNLKTHIRIHVSIYYLIFRLAKGHSRAPLKDATRASSQKVT